MFWRNLRWYSPASFTYSRIAHGDILTGLRTYSAHLRLIRGPDHVTLSPVTWPAPVTSRPVGSLCHAPLSQSNGAAYHSRGEIPTSLWLHVRLGYQVVWKWNRVLLLCCRLAIKPFRCKLTLLRSSVFMIRIDLWVFIAKPKYMCTQERF